ncbi:MAG TPA: flagellar biosynthetic protein FliO [Pseudolabrys sp.]
MFETVFGSEMPLAARFFIAFLAVLALIGVTAWVVRRFGSNRLGGNARGRQPRLAVIDAATVDGRRRLVLIRRDNVEHLLMIGGPTDVVVEPNIVRATAGREIAREPAPRQTQLAESSWPLQPSNEPAPIAASRSYRSSATEEPWLAPEPGARPRPNDSLTGLASELSTRLGQSEPSTPAARSEPRPAIAPMVPPPISTPPEPAAPAQTDHNLAEMAQQLEAALRRTPMPDNRPPVTDPLAASLAKPAPARDFKPRVEPKFDPTPKNETKNETKAEPAIEIKPEPKFEPPAAPAKAPLDNLEEEMASLLGRPPGKT